MKNQIQTPKTEEEEKRSKGAVIGLSLKRKTLLLGVTFVLLIALIVAGTAAWYTRVSNVSGITMKVAEFDFNANFQSDDFQVNAFDFAAVDDFKAAPGAGGVIPIEVNASESAVDVDYSIALNFSDMAPEFKKRIRFFYYTDENGDNILEEHTINPSDPNAGIHGRMPSKGEKIEYLYWEWVYDLNPTMYYDVSKDVWTTNAALFTSKVVTNQVDPISGVEIKTTADAINSHDEIDTKIGFGEYDKVFTSSGIDPQTGTSPRVYTEKSTTMSTIKMDPVTKLPIKWDQSENVTISAIQQAMEVRILITGGQAKPMYEAPTDIPPAKQGTSYFNPDKTPITPTP